MKELNVKLMQAFRDADMETILQEIQPLIYKNAAGVPLNVREDLIQELILTSIKVVKDYDYHNNGDLNKLEMLP